MKISHLAIIVAQLSAFSNACITAHVYLNNCVISGDVLRAQVFDNGKKVCDGGKKIDGASNTSKFCIDNCNKGYKFCVMDNTKKAHITTPNGYQAIMNAGQRHGPHLFTCLAVGDNSEVKGSEYEACFSDHLPNCANYKKCDLCDYRSSCS